MVRLAVINALSTMAITGSSTFGILAILSGKTVFYGLWGLGLYIGLSAFATYLSYVGTCYYLAKWGWGYRKTLECVFIIYATGFLLGAFIHPACLALSTGIGLGVYYAAFMLKSLHHMEDHNRDRYATLNGFLQQVASLLTPILGSLMIMISEIINLSNHFIMTFLSFALCVLPALYLLQKFDESPLHAEVKRSLKESFSWRYSKIYLLIVSILTCESSFSPLLILSSYALLGRTVSVGWYTSFVALVAAGSLLLSHHHRSPGRRWVIMSLSLVTIGISFMVLTVFPSMPLLLIVGAIYAVMRANHLASWYALSSRIIEKEWGKYGRNQALVICETWVFISRIMIALFLLLLSSTHISLNQALHCFTLYYLSFSLLVPVLAKKVDGNGV